MKVMHSFSCQKRPPCNSKKSNLEQMNKLIFNFLFYTLNATTQASVDIQHCLDVLRIKLFYFMKPHNCSFWKSHIKVVDSRWCHVSCKKGNKRILWCHLQNWRQGQSISQVLWTVKLILYFCCFGLISVLKFSATMLNHPTF